MVKVCKFGGTSLSSAAAFRRVREIIEADPARRYIVVSAPGKREKEDSKVTDLLYEAARTRKYPSTVEERFLDIREGLSLTYSVTQALRAAFDHFLATNDTAYLVSRGEYLNAFLLAEYLGFFPIDAADCISLCCNGRADASMSAKRTQRALAGKEHAVIAGFYGVDQEGRIALLSRGGSDVTGALVAHAVGAEEYENWTDVAGIYDADPRTVEGARPLKQLTYGSLRQLAHLGATVMHEDAIFPLLSSAIPLTIKNTLAPCSQGTRVVAFSSENRAKGVTGKIGFSALKSEQMSKECREALAAGSLGAEHILQNERGEEILIFDSQRLAAYGSNVAAVPLALLTVIGIRGTTAFPYVQDALCARGIYPLAYEAVRDARVLVLAVKEEQLCPAWQILHALLPTLV